MVKENNCSERELVAKFLSWRKEEDFRELYRRFAPKLNQLIIRLLGSMNGDLQDVIQTTWFRAIQNLAAFRWESNLQTWLTGIAINCSREYQRKCRKTTNSEWVENMDRSTVPRINLAVNRIDLEKAITSLPDGYREVLILHDIEGYTHDEIARFLGIESGTSKSQLSRARKVIRFKFSERDGEKNNE
ncbi:RNA polymerase sigma factor [candidate division CSSED10-310 bacterium]|uniref:RNA polymerase sigma factor n=1 Tax=candidate division CSSED10-310 bacterium TaxID=2855610 RepID=A0ABV6Z2V0_UNCC1